MACGKTESGDDSGRFGRTGAGMFGFIMPGFVGVFRLSFFLLLCFAMASGSSSSPSAAVSVAASMPDTTVSKIVISDGSEAHNINEFYDVKCHSHFYGLSVSSFASIWMMVNAIVFICAFGVFMRHWCYKAFTSDTAKGY
ncbi:M73 protein [Murid betaherpesvirus 1]|uniref:M73 protein n=1 Tax=Murid herpesvirus 1 TaxID=10366 RepID=H2A0W3_MUHV1|nr:M73 protein [Murid betaherpesvirus 1]CCE56577.1 m73 protein [Murid betaherpesvirus 1]